MSINEVTVLFVGIVIKTYLRDTTVYLFLAMVCEMKPKYKCKLSDKIINPK